MRNSDVMAVLKLANGMKHDRLVRAGILATVAGDTYDEAIERMEEVVAALPTELPKGRDRDTRLLRDLASDVRETLTQGLGDVKQLREYDRAG